VGVLVLGLAVPAAGAAPGGRTAAAPRPFGYTLSADRTYGPYGVDSLLDIYVPDGAGPFPAVVIVHSGGWKYGDKTEWAPEAIKLADAGIVAVRVNYR
jgi:acetyl esterase/lipase